MIRSDPKPKLIRNASGILLLLLAINAFAGGYYGILGAKNIPIEWLEGSPFKTYLIPALLLFIIISGSALTAAVLAFRHNPFARKAVFYCGLIVLIWLCAEVYKIGYVSWMQSTTAVIAVLIILLNRKLPAYAH